MACTRPSSLLDCNPCNVLRTTFKCLFVLFLTAEVVSIRLNALVYPKPTFRNGCRLLLNEINFHTDNIYEKQFVEVSRYCQNRFHGQRSVTMSNFKIIFITHDGFLSGVCSLRGELKPKKKIMYDPVKADPGPNSEKKAKIEGTFWLFTVGHGYTGLNMDISDCEVVPSGLNAEKKTRFPIGSQYPVAVAVIYNEKSSAIAEIKLQKEGEDFIKTKITRSMQDKITWYLEDMYVYGSNTMYQYCDYFSKFYVFQNEPGTLLRDWNVRGMPDRSLSRCSRKVIDMQIMPFQPKLFAYTTPSPGEINICRSAADFRIENTQEYRTAPLELIIPSDQSKCYSFSTDSANELGLITSDVNFRLRLAESVGEGSTSSPLQDPDVDGEDEAEPGPSSVMQCNNVQQVDINDDEAIEPENNLPGSTGFQYNPIDAKTFEDQLENGKPYIWENCDKFDEVRQDQISQLSFTPIKLVDVLQTDVCNWFTYIQATNKFRCKLCHELFKQSVIFERPNSQKIPGIVKDGVMDMHPRNRKFNNRKLIDDHKDSMYHQIALQWYRLYDQGLRLEDLKTQFEDEDGLFKTYIGSTRNMMATVRQAVIMGLTFFNFQKLTELVNYYKGDIGHLYQNTNGMRLIVTSISTTMHEQFISFLKEKSPSVGLLIDSTTDSSGRTVTMVLFMTSTAEEGTKIRLYTVLDLPEGEKAQQIFDALILKLTKDNLVDWFRSSLNSVTTDGASSMYSLQNGLNGLLRRFTGRPIVRVWCSNHKQDLAYRHTVNNHPGLAVLPSVVNRVSRMFNKNSPKRKNLLRIVTTDLGGKPFEVKRTHRIRWINGNLRAFTGLLDHWVFIVRTLQKIEVDQEFADESQTEASKLLLYLLDPTFLANLAFLCDLGKAMADGSLASQKFGKTLIGKRDTRFQMLAYINTYSGNRNWFTPTVRKLVQDSDSETLEHFEMSSGLLRGVALNPPLPVSQNKMLFQKHTEYWKTLTDNINNYFYPDEQDSYDVFNPQKFPISRDARSVYGVEEIQGMNRELEWGFNEAELSASWTKALSGIIEHAKYNSKKNNPPEEFWSFYMGLKEDVGFDRVSRGLLEKVLTVSSSNAEAERCLGIFARTKNNLRFLLQTGMVEAILRVKINGDDGIENFDTMTMAKNFVLEGHSRSNDASRRDTWLSPKKWDALVANGEAEDGFWEDDSDIEFNESNDSLVTSSEDDTGADTALEYETDEDNCG